MSASEGNILIRSAIGARVVALRTQSGLTQDQLAQMVDIDRSYLCKVENGEANVTIDYLVKISNGYDIPITFFFAGMENNPPRKLTKQAIEYALVKLSPRKGEDNH